MRVVKLLYPLALVALLVLVASTTWAVMDKINYQTPPRDVDGSLLRVGSFLDVDLKGRSGDHIVLFMPQCYSCTVRNPSFERLLKSRLADKTVLVFGEPRQVAASRVPKGLFGRARVICQGEELAINKVWNQLDSAQAVHIFETGYILDKWNDNESFESFLGRVDREK